MFEVLRLARLFSGRHGNNRDAEEVGGKERKPMPAIRA